MNKKIISIIGNRNEGKSIVAFNLALNFSKKSKKVLLINNENKKTDERIKQINNYLYFTEIQENQLNKKIEILKNEFELIIIEFHSIYRNERFINKKTIKILVVEANILQLKKLKELIFLLNNKNNYILLNKTNINSIDEKLIKNILKDYILLGKIKYSNKYNEAINTKQFKAVNKKEYLRIIKNLEDKNGNKHTKRKYEKFRDRTKKIFRYWNRKINK